VELLHFKKTTPVTWCAIGIYLQQLRAIWDWAQQELIKVWTLFVETWLFHTKAHIR
jgi:hypothetical protein